MRWHIHAIPTFERQQQEDQKFKVSLGYTGNWRSASLRNLVSKNKDREWGDTWRGRGRSQRRERREKTLLLNTELKQLADEINLISFQFTMCVICSI